MKTYHVELAVSPKTPAWARRHTRRAALRWNLPELADEGELCVSELVTNAVLASNGRADAVVRLWIVADDDSLVLAVHDNSDDLPVRRDAGPDDTGGRGLMIVNALASRWGAYRTVPGKLVYCVVERVT